MSIGILIKRAARRALVKDILEEWYRRDPEEAKACVREMRLLCENEYKRFGEWQSKDGDPNEAGGFCSIRIPATLFWGLRRVIPEWGEDSQDIADLAADFEDLVPAAMRKRARSRRK